MGRLALRVLGSGVLLFLGFRGLVVSIQGFRL